MPDTIQLSFRLETTLVARLDAFAKKLELERRGLAVTRADATRILLISALDEEGESSEHRDRIDGVIDQQVAAKRVGAKSRDDGAIATGREILATAEREKPKKRRMRQPPLPLPGLKKSGKKAPK